MKKTTKFWDVGRKKRGIKIPLFKEIFWERVKKTKTCWLWQGRISKWGYAICWNHKLKKQIRMHRFSWELHHGKIPKKLVLDHLCRVRHCVNPAHLETVTCKENILRGNGLASINAKKTHCLRGHPFKGNIYESALPRRRLCKICSIKREKIRKQKNPEKYKKYQRDYYLKRLSRTRKGADL